MLLVVGLVEVKKRCNKMQLFNRIKEKLFRKEIYITKRKLYPNLFYLAVIISGASMVMAFVSMFVE